MEELYYIGLDVHKKSISYALKPEFPIWNSDSNMLLPLVS